MNQGIVRGVVSAVLLSVFHAPAAPTVALLDFRRAKDPNLLVPPYQGFTMLVQSELVDRSDCVLVERSAIADALAENELQAMTEAGYGRVAKMLRADLVIDGRFEGFQRKGWSTRRTGTRYDGTPIIDRKQHPKDVPDQRLSLLAIDTGRGLPLATNVVEFPNGMEPAKADLNLAGEVAGRLAELIELAEQRKRVIASQTVVAALHLWRTETLRAPQYDHVEADLIRELRLAARGGDFFIHSLGGAGEAVFERELSLLGLVTANTNAWREIADVYVWGEIQSNMGDPAIELTIWNGTAKPIILREVVPGMMPKELRPWPKDKNGKPYGTDKQEYHEWQAKRAPYRDLFPTNGMSLAVRTLAKKTLARAVKSTSGQSPLDVRKDLAAKFLAPFPRSETGQMSVRDRMAQRNSMSKTVNNWDVALGLRHVSMTPGQLESALRMGEIALFFDPGNQGVSEEFHKLIDRKLDAMEHGWPMNDFRSSLRWDEHVKRFGLQGNWAKSSGFQSSFKLEPYLWRWATLWREVTRDRHVSFGQTPTDKTGLFRNNVHEPPAPWMMTAEFRELVRMELARRLEVTLRYLAAGPTAVGRSRFISIRRDRRITRQWTGEKLNALIDLLMNPNHQVVSKAEAERLSDLVIRAKSNIYGRAPSSASRTASVQSGAITSDNTDSLQVFEEMKQLLQRQPGKKYPDEMAAFRYFSEQVGNLFADRKFEQLEQMMEHIRKHDGRFPSGAGFRQVFYDSVEKAEDKNWNAAIGRAKRWVDSVPGSATARIVRANLLKRHGWSIRGTGPARTVSADSWKRMREKMVEAEAVLKEAEKFSQDDPELYTARIGLIMAQSGPRYLMEKAFASAVALDPRYLPAYYSKALYLLPRWKGKSGDWQAFAREAGQRHLPEHGDSLFARIVIEMGFGIAPDELEIVSDATAGGLKISWTRLKPAIEEIMRHHPKSALFPSYLTGLCYRMGELEQGVSMLRALGDELIESASLTPWPFRSYREHLRLSKEPMARTPLRSWQVREGPLVSLWQTAFVPDSSAVVMPYDDGSVKFHSVADGKAICTIESSADLGGATSVAISSDSAHVAVGHSTDVARSKKPTLKVYSLADLKETTAREVTFTPWSLFFGANSKRLTAACGDNRVGGELWVLQLAEGTSTNAMVRRQWPFRHAFNMADSDRVIASYANGLAAWRGANNFDFTAGVARTETNAMNLYMHGLALSPDQRHIVIGRGGFQPTQIAPGRLEVRELKNIKQSRRTPKEDVAGVTAVAWSSDGRWIFSAGYDFAISIWDAQTLEKRAVLIGPSGAPSWITCSFDSRKLAVSEYSGKVNLFDLSFLY